MTQNVYAIVRYDEFQPSDVAIENRVKVVQIVDDESTARAEVARLSEVNSDRRCKYFWQATRFGKSSA